MILSRRAPSIAAGYVARSAALPASNVVSISVTPASHPRGGIPPGGSRPLAAADYEAAAAAQLYRGEPPVGGLFGAAIQRRVLGRQPLRRTLAGSKHSFIAVPAVHAAESAIPGGSRQVEAVGGVAAREALLQPPQPPVRGHARALGAATRQTGAGHTGADIQR